MMEGCFGASFAENFEGLAKLLSDHDQTHKPPSPTAVSTAKQGPAGIGPEGIFPDVKVAEPEALEDPNAIWAVDEVCDFLESVADDGRQIPEYSFYYKQAVQTGDVYLGLDPMGKDPTSTSCEDLVLAVELPDVTSVSDIDVDLSSTSVTLLTAKHRLKTYLPHEVNSDKSIAQWDSKKHQLKITMRRSLVG